METLPVISLVKLAEDTRENQEVKRLYETCLDHGFFYLKDHNISSRFSSKNNRYFS